MTSMASMNSVTRVYALILGMVLLVIGVFGWIPALTTGGLFLSMFALSPAHNLVHLLTGVVGVGAGLLLPDRSVRLYTITMTVVYGLVAIVGYVQASALAVLALNLPDTLLHTAIFVLSLLVVLAAFSEQGLRVRYAQLSASQFRQAPQQPQQRTSSAGFATMPPHGLLQAGPQQSPDIHDIQNSVAALHERLRWLKRDVDKIDPLTERLQALEQEVLQLRREVGLLRGSVQTPTQGQPLSRPSATSWPGSLPAWGGEADQGTWPRE